jgi:tetratricopeptide (TPR) repeat protein
VGRVSVARADAAARKALEADEYLLEAPLVIERLYRSEYTLARYDSASAWCRLGRERFPNDWRFVDCRLTLLGYQGGSAPDVGLALRLYDEASQLDPPEAARAAGRPYFPIYRRLAVARVLARAHQADSARAILTRVRREVGSDPALLSSFWYDEAYVRHLLGDDPGVVIALLERYVSTSPSYRDYVRNDVQFRDLHADPRFRSFLR